MKVRQDVIIKPPKIEYEPYISISLEEYKELLIYKGKYLGLRDKTIETTKFIDGKVVATILEDVED